MTAPTTSPLPAPERYVAAARACATTNFVSPQDDAVARVCERVGFAPVGTACLGEVA